jgi:hypothetical protein
MMSSTADDDNFVFEWVFRHRFWQWFSERAKKGETPAFPSLKHLSTNASNGILFRATGGTASVPSD